MENIIFEDPSRRIVPQKRAKSSSSLKKDTSDLPIFHEQYTARPSCPYPPRDQLEKGVSDSMTSCTVGDRTDSYPEDHGSSSGHEPQIRQAAVGGPVSLHDLFTLAGGDDQHSTDDDNNESADDIFSHSSENALSSTSITSAGTSPDYNHAPVHDVTVRLEEQPNVQSSSKLQVKSDKDRSKRPHSALTKAPSVICDSEDPGSGSEDSKSDAETDGDEALGDRWEYKRIVARRIDSSGRRMAKVRWKDTWEPESELSNLETALLLEGRRKRREKQNSKEICLSCGARRRKNFA